MEMDSILENRKNYQRNKMLSVIRLHENISRNDVKKITAYSMTTVLSTIDELIQEGLVYEESCNDSRVGGNLYGFVLILRVDIFWESNLTGMQFIVLLWTLQESLFMMQNVISKPVKKLQIRYWN